MNICSKGIITVGWKALINLFFPPSSLAFIVVYFRDVVCGFSQSKFWSDLFQVKVCCLSPVAFSAR